VDRFKRLALLEWDRRTGGMSWAPCEGCGYPIERGTVPHHSNAAGLGGKRKHVQELFRYLCRSCHDKEHF